MENPNLVKSRVDNLSIVVDNFREVLKTKKIYDTATFLAVILYKVYELGSLFGIDLEKTFDLVHASNMTKACKNEQEAIDTVNYMKEKEPRYKEPTYKLSKDKRYWIVYDGATGKTLKSKYYSAVDLSYIAK